MPFKPDKTHLIALPFEEEIFKLRLREDDLPIKIYKLFGELDFRPFYKKYKRNGGVAYKPEIMFGLLILSILDGGLSSREIEEKCYRDAYYRFFVEKDCPDHTTISRFIQKFPDEISRMSEQIVRLGFAKGVSQFKAIAIDGTKIAAKSSKYQSMYQSRLESALESTKKALAKTRELDKIDNEKEEYQKKRIKRLEEKGKKIETCLRELPERQAEIKNKSKREKHQINIEEPDARMMDKIFTSGYNIQFSVDVDSQIIVTNDVVVDRSDCSQFIPQYNNIEKVIGKDEERVYLADSSYQNTNCLKEIEDKNINAFINNSQEKEELPPVKEIIKRDKGLTIYHFKYDKDIDAYICPTGKKLIRIIENEYECQECIGCPIKQYCTKSEKKNIHRSEYQKYNEEMQKKISENKFMMNLRKSVERVFGNLKWNYGFRRFRRKGLRAVKGEIALWASGLNILKLSRMVF